MVSAVYCLGRENLEWLAERYIPVSSRVRGVIQLSRLLIEALRVIEGSEAVTAVAEELRRRGRSDLAEIIEAVLGRSR